MNLKIIEKAQIAQFVESIPAKKIAPVKEEGLITFQEISSAEEIFWDFLNTQKSPKEFLFPQSERLFRYQRTDHGFELGLDEIEAEKKALIGLHPCDIKSFLILDKLFDNERYKDNYYIEKRKNTLIIGLACNHPLNTCFCTSVDGGPFSSEGADILLIDLGDRYLMQIVSEKGKEFGSKFKDAQKSDIAEMEKRKKQAISSIKTNINLNGLYKKLEEIFEEKIWETLSEKCLNCGACTYVCPTCHCFDIQDELKADKGIRIRNWDSCMFNLFTKHGSGHNPRTKGFQRMRQRIMHKFSYYIRNFGVTACVGCGRCILNCPVNMDIRGVLDTLIKY